MTPLHTRIAALIGVALPLLAPAHLRAQDFTDLKSALVDYSKADLQPRQAAVADHVKTAVPFRGQADFEGDLGR